MRSSIFLETKTKAARDLNLPISIVITLSAAIFEGLRANVTTNALLLQGELTPQLAPLCEPGSLYLSLDTKCQSLSALLITIDIRLPLVQDGVEVVKLASRTLVYLHVPSKTPLFFDVDGRNKLFPTVYALWRVRQLSAEADAQSGSFSLCCPTLVVHPPVSKFVLNGADVMLPGALMESKVGCFGEV